MSTPEQIRPPRAAEQPVRQPDPDVLQRQASDPLGSVWVGASAGTGKTKVLTDRILRLLLPPQAGVNGTPAHKILALTFTRAAASEMILRLQDRLGAWAVISDDELVKDLNKLLGRDPREDETTAARRLFADIIEVPGGLKIMTIHAFCQSVLGRFPIEAGLTPGFSVLEENEARDVLEDARKRFWARWGRPDTVNNADKTHPFSRACQSLAANLSEDQLRDMIRALSSERRQLSTLLKTHFGPQGLYENLCRELHISPESDTQDLMSDACRTSAFDRAGLQAIGEIMCESKSKTDAEKGHKIVTWCKMDPEKRHAYLDTYRFVFLTKDDTVRARLATKNVTDAKPDALQILTAEAERLLMLREKVKALSCAMLTRDLFMAGEQILSEYAASKHKKGGLDYEDLILKTLDILNGQSPGFTFKDAAAWVLYKLDQGLDHILIDEAQDTNPEQWRIVEALCAEFVAGMGAASGSDDKDAHPDRTLFVVGDEKQSIYSFQRASPEEFQRMQKDMYQRFSQARLNWKPVDLNMSFRSTPAVLKAVDAVFANSVLRAGTGGREVEHTSYRSRQAGHVELWPLEENDPAEDLPLWQSNTQLTGTTGGAAKLAARIASTIKTWLETEESLLSRDRPVRPGDIMILVKSRTALVGEMLRALKAENIPVSGSDRMMINNELAVQDVLAACAFALAPDDDLTLACLLKSPFIQCGEEDLFDMAYDRPGSLWHAVQTHAPAPVTRYLQELIESAGRQTPFSFLQNILCRPCPGDEISGERALKKRLGGDIFDALDELLANAIAYTRNHEPSLQGFLHWQKTHDSEIKRESDSAGNEVRIMTVHGAKGLQAPIVILPDTIRQMRSGLSKADRRLLWPDKTGLPVPLWVPRRDMECELYKNCLATLNEREDQEYARLLYVAMTRAEDRLYIGGYVGEKTPLPESWYYYIKDGLESLSGYQKNTEGGVVYTSPQIGAPDRKDPGPADDRKWAGEDPAPPDWLFQAVRPEEEAAAGPATTPAADRDVPVLSPLQAGDDYRFRRGNLTHKLLEILPDLPPDKREDAGRHFLARQRSGIPEELQAHILEETLGILESSDFAPLFGPGSRAEVPLAGKLKDGRVINARIDRLLITPDRIWIIDYKTNRPPPQDKKDIPEAYRRQLQDYADLIRLIYPERQLTAALLWTDGPVLMPLDV